MASQGPDAAHFRLGKERMVSEPLILQQGVQRPGTAAKPQGIDGQDGQLWIHVVARIARGRMLARHGLTHDHPQRIAGRNIVPTGEHEFVTEWMLGTTVVIAQPTEFWPCQMGRHVVRRIRQRPAKMSCLGIIPEQHQGHAGHVPDVLKALSVIVHLQWLHR